jgi:hypothetical protein
MGSHFDMRAHRAHPKGFEFFGGAGVAHLFNVICSRFEKVPPFEDFEFLFSWSEGPQIFNVSTSFLLKPTSTYPDITKTTLQTSPTPPQGQERVPQFEYLLRGGEAHF